MLIIEPPDRFFDRIKDKQCYYAKQYREFDHHNATQKEHPDGWDYVIMNFFIRQPGAVVLFMRAVNALVRHCRSRCKLDREKAKIIIIRSIGRLIREGRLKRVKRRFVRINQGELTGAPLIPTGVPLPKAQPIRPGASKGSTPGTTAIQGGVFV